MTQHANSMELLPLPNPQQSPSKTNSALSPKPTTLSNWRWREMISAAFIVVDFFFLYSTISLIGVFFPAEAGNKTASVFVTGVIIGVTPLVVTVLAPIVGYLLPILTIPFSIIAGLILVGAVYIGLGLSIYLPSGWPFIVTCVVLRIIEGVATALFTTAGYTLVTELYSDSTGFIVVAMGIAEVGAGLGYASGPVIGGFLYKAGGYKLPFFVVGGLCFFLVIPTSLILKSSRGKSTRQLLRLQTLFNLLKNFIILLLVLGVILQLAGFGFLTTAYSLFLEEQFGLTPDKIGLVFAAISVPYAVSAPSFGKLADVTNPRILVICGLCLSGFGYLLIGPTSILPVKPTLWLTIFSEVVVGIGAGTSIVCTYSDVLSQSLSDSEQEELMGVVAGMISAAMSFGEFLGPVIGGGLVDVTSFRASASVVGEVMLALTTLLLMVTIIDHSLGKGIKQHSDISSIKSDRDKINNAH